MQENPEVRREGCLDVQVCVPETWTDQQVKTFADEKYPCGTSLGWCVRKDLKLLNGDPERNPCSDKKGYVHITMDC